MTKDLLNRLAPDFSLPSLGGGRFTLSDCRGQIVVLNFWSAECAWSRRADVLLVYRQQAWDALGVRIVSVAANFNEPEAALGFEVEKRHVRYPILLDPEQKVADLYGALTTPHFFVIDRKRQVQYMGALDDMTIKERRAHRMYLDEAVSALAQERLPETAATSPYGCPINRLRASNAGQAVQKAD